MHYAKTAPAAMEERAERKSQNPAGSNISVIQHVESFLLRNQQKKHSINCTEKNPYPVYITDSGTTVVWVPEPVSLFRFQQVFL